MDMWLDVDAAINVPVNLMPLIDDTDFKTRETGIVYNQAGMDLVWNFVTTAGVISQTAVTPTTAGDYDWTHSGDAMYKVEMPASGGASINNDTEGFGWFTGICDGVLAWRGPIIGFRPAALNNALINSGDGFLPTGSRAITIQLYETATTTPIADVVVTILNDAETLIVAVKTTDVNGQIAIDLDDATYKLRSRKAGATFTTPETLVVTDDATEIFYGDTFTIAAPADPDVCRIYDYLFLADGVTKPDSATVRAEITKLPFNSDGKIHSGDIITEVYDSATGLLYWDIVQGATVSFFIEDYIEVTRVVPALSTQRLATL